MNQASPRSVPKRTLGIASATAMLVGTVVGASVFIVPGQLASSVGPAVWLSYLIGASVILFTAMVFAQIGSVMPVSAAVYRVSVSAVNGSWGFLYISGYSRFRACSSCRSCRSRPRNISACFTRRSTRCPLPWV